MDSASVMRSDRERGPHAVVNERGSFEGLPCRAHVVPPAVPPAVERTVRTQRAGARVGDVDVDPISGRADIDRRVHNKSTGGSDLAHAIGPPAHQMTTLDAARVSDTCTPQGFVSVGVRELDVGPVRGGSNLRWLWLVGNLLAQAKHTQVVPAPAVEPAGRVDRTARGRGVEACPSEVLPGARSHGDRPESHAPARLIAT